jgi:hypothetical protein
MLRSGYFDDFKSGPKVLLWGDREAMQKLAALLRAASIGHGPLGLDSFSEAVDGRSIVIEPTSRSYGMISQDGWFRWGLDPETSSQFAEMIDVLAEVKEPGHQYLECGVLDEIVVMVARDEYPADLNPKVRLDAASA